jgi:SAM-dependent methyltransferase
MEENMAIGSFLAKESNTKIGKQLVSCLGTPDIHSHTRLQPVLNYFDRRKTERLKILEIGCGTGWVLLEICSIGPAFSATGIDIDQGSIKVANRRVELLTPQRDIKFLVGDALVWDSEDTYDVVILIDVLEHLRDTKHILETVSHRLKHNGTLLISVPTPMYPRVFGQEFHELVGHVKDGYTKETLSSECSGFHCVEYSYNTGPCFWIPCALSYRFIRHIRNYKIQSILNFLLVPFAMFDLWHPPKWSCSLFAEFVQTA